MRGALEDEIKRLTALLSQATEAQERLRGEHAEAMAGKDQDLRRAVERHAGQEKRMLEDVDRARQSAKQAETGFAREQQRRIQSEEAAAQTLEAGRQRLRETQQAAQEVERELRERVAEQASLLAGSQSQASALQQRLEDLERQLGEEKQSHEATRGLLADALAAVRGTEKAARKTPVRRGKAASSSTE